MYDDNNVWVDTQPKDVIDFGGQESSILKLELKILKEENAFIKEIFEKKEKEYAQRIASMESEIAKLRHEMKSLSTALLPEETVMRTLTDSKTVLEVKQTTLYKHTTKGKKQKGKKQKGKKPWCLAKASSSFSFNKIRQFPGKLPNSL